MPVPSLGTGADLNGARPFSADSVWNLRVDTAPLMANSDQIIASLRPTDPLHPDFGAGRWEGHLIGIPYVVVPPDQPMVPFLNNLYPSESDPGPYPIPPNPPVQGIGATGYNDRHLLIAQQDPNSPSGFGTLYEMFQATQTADGTWQGFGAKFDMNKGDLQRPFGWTSADAAGLPIFPGLVKYEEVQEAIAEAGDQGFVDHAIRFTLENQYIGQNIYGAASHTTNGSGPAGFGMHFRLRNDFPVDPSLSAESKVVINTLKKHGMILADNGANWHIVGSPDERWNNGELNRIKGFLQGDDFEVVDSAALRNGSGGSTPPPPPTAPTPGNVTVGTGSDTLALKISQDAYQGSAQYTVKVDGMQIGGTQTAVALHSSGQSDTLTVKGDWASGAHNVAITFLNDAYGGTATTDRNLYLDGATYNGAPVTATTGSVLSYQPTSFAIQDSTPAPGTTPPPPPSGPTTGDDTLTGTTNADTIDGLAGNDSIRGGGGNDTIIGNAGNDTLNGEAGADVIRGGAGKDIMTGGTEADQFDFDAYSQSPYGQTSRDQITDFAPGVDDIDLRTIDAWSGVSGDQAFVFRGSQGFSGGGVGSVRVAQETGYTVVEVDSGDGGTAEMQIQLNKVSLTSGDFLL